MAVFSKSAPAPIKPTQVVNIPEGTVFTGNVSASSPVRIDGHLNGNMTTESSAAIGATGQVKGNITAGDVNIGGVVTGDIASTGIIVVISPGRLTGNVQAKGLNIELGSAFSGKCEIAADKDALYLPASEADKPGE